MYFFIPLIRMSARSLAALPDVVFFQFATCVRDASDPGSGCELFIAMNKLQFKGGWNEVKGKLKQKYGQLTDNDLTFAEGKDEELLGRLQTRLGKSKEAPKGN